MKLHQLGDQVDFVIVQQSYLRELCFQSFRKLDVKQHSQLFLIDPTSPSPNKLGEEGLLESIVLSMLNNT